MSHASTSTPPSANRKGGSRKSRDEDSDSSIEIVGEYSMADNGTTIKKSDPLNLAMPTLNKDKYKKLTSSGGGGGGGSSGSSSSTKNSSKTTTINNNLDKHAGKYGGFALPMTGLHQPQDLKASTSIPSPQPQPPPTTAPRMSSSAPNDLDVIRIMKELQELQVSAAFQVAPPPFSNASTHFSGHPDGEAIAPASPQRLAQVDGQQFFNVGHATTTTTPAEVGRGGAAAAAISSQ